jgi:thioredoxin reductase (NADPH)
MKDIIVVGAGCAGLTAAIYAARAGKSVLVLEGSNIGGQISYSPRIENYPGFSTISGAEFSDQLYDQAISFGAEIDLVKIAGIGEGEQGFWLDSDQGKYWGKAIILATGVSHRTLGLSDEQRLSGKGVSYCAICDGAFYTGERVVVVGGGNTALLGAESLAGYCKEVILVHRRESFRGEEALWQRVKDRGNIRVITSAVVKELHGKEELEGVVIRHVVEDREERLSVSGLFILAGQIPNNQSFSSLVSLDEEGYIITDPQCSTSKPGIFAAGDCRQKRVRQLTTAAADGTVAALEAVAYIQEKLPK